MDTERFVVEQNVAHFRDRLWHAVDPAAQAELRRLLVQEEDALGRNLEQLSLAEREVVKWDGRIASQQSIIASYERAGRDAALPRQLLDSLVLTRTIHEQFRQKMVTALNGSARGRL